VSPELEWENGTSQVKLIFHIDEGKRYRLGNFQVDGLKDLPQDKVMAVMRGKEGEYYDEKLQKTNLEIIKALPGWEGVDANARRELTFKENGEVDVRIEVNERQPARVGQIIIIGNKTTRQNVILRQVPLYPGQILTYPDLRIAENNL